MEKLSSLAGLRLASLRSKGYTAEQLAALLETLQEIFDDINASLQELEEHAGSAHAPATAEENSIVSIRRNGVVVAPVNKVVDLSVPVKTSELENDKGYATTEEVNGIVGSSGHLGHVVVDTLPSPSAGLVNTIYYVRKNNGEAGNQYREYQLINGAFELVGDASPDLSGYALLTDVEKADAALIQEVFDTAKAPQEKYVGTGNLATFWSLLKPLYEGHELTINDIIARVALLELTTNAAINGNSYYVTFESLTGLEVAGVWNETDGRIEF